jgi:hypothetical protein
MNNQNSGEGPSPAGFTRYPRILPDVPPGESWVEGNRDSNPANASIIARNVFVCNFIFFKVG